MEIYIDILFLENFIINYLVLAITGSIAAIKNSEFRKIAGAALGAAYVVFIVIRPDLYIYSSLIAKFLLSLLMIAVTFNISKLISFIKILAVFYAITFMMAGSSMAFMYLINGGWIVESGILGVVTDSGLQLPILGILTTLIVGRALWSVLSYNAAKSSFMMEVRIYFKRTIVSLDALVDTGNMLLEPLAGLPVMVAEYKALKELLPKEISGMFSQDSSSALLLSPELLNSSGMAERFRLIPYSSIGTQNGMLLGFRPDKITFMEKKSEKILGDAVVAIYNRPLSEEGKYQALISFDMLK